jgi:hypothetical protein
MKLYFSGLLFACLLAAPAWAATGTMIKDDEMRTNASANSAAVGRVAKGASVEVLTRKGGWTQIRHAGATGWVRILSVRSSAETGGNVLGGIVQMGAERRDPSRVVAVAGLRGLNEEELRGARFNANELARLDQFSSSRVDAEQFARGAGLRSRDVAYINAARREQENRPSGNSSGIGFGDGNL